MFVWFVCWLILMKCSALSLVVSRNTNICGVSPALPLDSQEKNNRYINYNLLKIKTVVKSSW